MSQSFEQHVLPLMSEGMERADVPGMIVAAWREGAPLACVVNGTDARGETLTEDTLFPVTSITKLALSLCILRLVDNGVLRLDDLLQMYVPEAQAAQPGVTLRTLLSHTSGLPAIEWAEELVPYGPGLTWAAVAQASLHVPLTHPPNTRVVYAGADANLLATIVERITQRPFGSVLRAEVLEPLGVEGYFGEEPHRAPAVIAPTTGHELEPWNSAFWRTLGLPGSGLLTTAGDILTLLHAFLGYPPDYLRAELRQEAIRNQSGTLAGGVEGWFEHTPCPWGLGPGLQGSFPNAPREASATSFGHSGSSGCIAWADPQRQVAWVILSTRAAEGRWPDREFPHLGAAIMEILSQARRDKPSGA